MIKNFKRETDVLTEYEEGVLLPIVEKCLKKHVGKENIITNGTMCEKLGESGYKTTEARMRKLINHIRNNKTIPYLVATGRGYYVAETIREMEDYIESLNGRIEAIAAMRDSMIEQRNRMKIEQENRVYLHDKH